MKDKKKLITVVTAILSVVSLAVGSLAFFTDRAQTNAEATAGTLDLALTQSWAADNTVVASNLRPGTALVLNYTLNNSGSSAATVREQFVISCDRVLTSSAPEFALYAADDVSVSADGIVTIKSGATAIPGTIGQYTVTDGGKTTTWNKLSYTFTQFNLNGSTEKISGVTTQKKDGAFVLVFNQSAGNTFQGTQLKIEYLAEALQFSGTDTATWNNAEVFTETISFGGTNQAVVPAASTP